MILHFYKKSIVAMLAVASIMSTNIFAAEAVEAITEEGTVELEAEDSRKKDTLDLSEEDGSSVEKAMSVEPNMDFKITGDAAFFVKLETNKKGAFRLSALYDGSSTSPNTATYTIYDEQQNILWSDNITNPSGRVYTADVYCGKNEFIYVKIDRYYSAPYPKNMNFRICLDTENIWASRANNSRETADTMQVNQEVNGYIHGVLQSYNDCDYWKVELTEHFAGFLDGDNESYHEVQLLDDSGIESGYHILYNNQLREKFSGKLELNPGIYYIKVSKQVGDNGRYKIRLRTATFKDDDKIATTVTDEMMSDVTFDTDGGVVEEGNIYTIVNGKALLSNPVKTGYAFKGWFYTDSKTDKIKKASKSLNARFLTQNPSAAFKAKWQENVYTVQFKIIKPDRLNKVVKMKAIKNQKVLYESQEVTLYDDSYIGCSGYELAGWTTDPEAKLNPVSDYELVTQTTMLAGDTKKNKKVVLYSVWKAVSTIL